MHSDFESVLDGAGGITLKLGSPSGPALECGFIGKGLLDQALDVPLAREAIAQRFSDFSVILPRQTHGDTVITPPEGALITDCEGDALSISLPFKRKTVACIRTADCVPILLLSPDRVALVHAGWRGLANRIIQKTVETFASGSPITALIGPCARGECYQVGQEVIDAIGPVAAVRSGSDNLYLDTGASAAAILAATRDDITTIDCGICTICDSRFHSFRRDGEKSGRNVSYVAFE